MESTRHSRFVVRLAAFFAAALFFGASLSPVEAQIRRIAPVAQESEAPIETPTDEVRAERARTEEAAAEILSGEAPEARQPLEIPATGRNNGAGKVVYRLRIDTDVIINDMIDRRWHFRLHRALTAAESAGADAFLLEINTNGGRLDAGFMMLERLLSSKIPTYAYVDAKAISAGAMIALGADEIFMKQASRIGDALPVMPDSESETGMKAASNKVISNVASQVRAAAKAKGHPAGVALAMVDPNQPLDGFTKKGELLTLTADEAVAAGLVDYIVSDTADLLRAIDMEGAEIITPKLTPLETIASFLSSHLVIALLSMIGLGGLMLEFKTPGVGLPALIGVSAFALMFFGSHVANLAGIIEPLLLIAGFALIALEIFVIPGFGVPGLAGLICVVLGIGLSTTEMPFSAAGIMEYWIGPAVYTVAGTLIGLFVSFPILLKMLPYIPYLNQAIIDPKLDPRSVGLPTPAASSLPPVEAGMTGVATTVLHPVGAALIGGEIYDVVSSGAYIDKDTAIVVKKVEGARIVVAPRV